MTNTRYYTLVGMLGVVALAVSYMGVLAFWPVPMVVYTNTPFPVLTKEVRPGEAVRYVVAYCREPGIGPVTVSRQFVNDVVIPLSDITSKMEDGCHEKVVEADRIPIFAPPGVYKIRIAVTQHVNPLRHVIQVNETEEFHVLPGKE